MNMNGCGNGNGSLPCPCAPLAFPYIPMQENDPARYSNDDAMRAGTLFPGLNLPFHKAIRSRFPAANNALTELMALD
ncbi:MAG: spore coat associated protein CotJA, partial [Oscillospiraceae bacterium]|nr:spore coat associated protein CotJA [Oscillospiraceae bacterium]